jgi:folylpolyglutamate synthase/dihydrofolate synthase
VRLNERFRLGQESGGERGGGVLVGDAELVEALAECERANGSVPITVFEMETAAGFLLFSRHPADALLLEVGLGGRLDATNVVALPLASVITPVSIDHVDFLGDTLEKIASEKAAIFKRGVPAVVSRQTEGPLSVIVQRAGEVGAPLHVAGQDWVASEERGRLVYQDEHGLLDLPSPRLFGRHQIDNAGTAIAALRAAGFKLPQAAYDDGLVRADWPARMQRLAAGDLLAYAPAGSEVWLDGAHNPDGGRIVAGALADLEERVSRSSSACWRARTARASCAISPGWRGASSRFRSARTRACPPRKWRRPPAPSAFPPTPAPTSPRRCPTPAISTSTRRREYSSRGRSTSPARFSPPTAPRRREPVPFGRRGGKRGHRAGRMQPEAFSETARAM